MVLLELFNVTNLRYKWAARPIIPFLIFHLSDWFYGKKPSKQILFQSFCRVKFYWVQRPGAI